MRPRRFQLFAILGALAGVACSSEVKDDFPLTGPAYVLTTEGADADVHDVLLRILRERLKPLRVAAADDGDIGELGTIHWALRVYGIKYETTDRSIRTEIPTSLGADVTVESTGGSSNWDGDHEVGFQLDAPTGSFSDAPEMRRRYARKLLSVAVDQLSREPFRREP